MKRPLYVLLGIAVLIVACAALGSRGGSQSGTAPTPIAALPTVVATNAPLPTAPPAPTVDTVAATMEAAAQVVPPTAKPTTAPTNPPGYISMTMLGDAWPLTVTHGELKCARGALVFVAPDGTYYAVNGTAKDRDLGVAFDPIWLDDPTVPGLKKSLQPLLDRGLPLCR